MRTETVSIYRFNELSDKAKERAREWYRCSMNDYAWGEENRESLKQFADTFHIIIRDWQVGLYSHSFVRIAFDTSGYRMDEVAELSGVRLATYLENNFWMFFRERKVIRLPVVLTVYDAPSVRIARTYKSKVQWEETCCPFTGYCFDEVLLDPIRAFLKKPDSRSYLDLMNDCVANWAKAYQDELEYNDSDEAVDEMLDVNCYEFTECGDPY
jgi:hypothetical protein